MSIPHILAPVRVSSVELKPTKKVSLKPDGTCECRRRATCPMDDSWRLSSWHGMSLETVTGRFLSLLPGRRRLAVAGWSKGA
ncbi:hypothetical protein EVAR_28805_1 [Eumeta japonica]|uniref:Uncharacterized protein n=1 Tax=Eumeta variegata TaxID=151549 RepID=A0A4C1WKH6_EUMVA|nr:hypothetical protein EVAR_28805_1 [Eumeta japonica]